MADFIWPELYFVRHGETNWNAEGRYQGSRDIPLNDRGRAQAALNGGLLKSLLARSGRNATDFTWYVSPLGRTRETMDLIRREIGEPLPDVSIDPRLVEVSFGIYEGHLHADLASGAMAMAGDRDASFWDFRPQMAKATPTSPVVSSTSAPGSPAPRLSSPMAASCACSAP